MGRPGSFRAPLDIHACDVNQCTYDAATLQRCVREVNQNMSRARLYIDRENITDRGTGDMNRPYSLNHFVPSYSLCGILNVSYSILALWNIPETCRMVSPTSDHYNDNHSKAAVVYRERQFVLSEKLAIVRNEKKVLSLRISKVSHRKKSSHDVYRKPVASY